MRVDSSQSLVKQLREERERLQRKLRAIDGLLVELSAEVQRESGESAKVGDSAKKRSRQEQIAVARKKAEAWAKGK